MDPSVKIRTKLLRRFARAVKGLTEQDAEDEPGKVINAALSRGVEVYEGSDDPEVAEAQHYLQSDEDLTPREQAELFDDRSDDSNETEELSESDKEKLQQELTDRVFGDYK